MESDLTRLTQELTRRSEQSTAEIEGLRQRLEQLDRSEQASRTSLESLERVIGELQAELHSGPGGDQNSELKEEIRRLTETENQIASRIETLHEDLLKVQSNLREKVSECCDRMRDLESRLHSLEDKKKDGSRSAWIANLLNGLGIVVGVIVGTVISPYINRNVDRRKYTLEIWEAFVKMYPEIEVAQSLLRSPIGLNPETLAKIQAVRAWMSAIATFSMESKVLDNTLLRKLDLGTPMRNFVALIQDAIEKTEQYLTQNPTAPQQERDEVAWVRKNLKTEWDLTADIQRFYQISS